MADFVLKPTHVLEVHQDAAKHFIIIGAGGNGAYFLRDMGRMVSLQNKRLSLAGRPVHKVTIIDADDVEEKNLTRQNFIRQDIGKKKAEALAHRYGAAYGLEIQYIDKYLDSAKMLTDIFRGDGMLPVIIGAVDNNKTRAIISEAFHSHGNRMFWIDAGNEEWGGQVVCGYQYQNKAVDKQKGAYEFYMPCVTDLYPEVLEAQDKLPHELSCAERAESAPQNVYTNIVAAGLMLGFVNTILTAESRKGEGLKHHAVAFNAMTSSFTTRLNTIDNLIPAEPVKEAAVVEKKTAKKKVAAK